MRNLNNLHFSLLIVLLTLTFNAFGQIDCNKLPTSFSSYEEARIQIQKAKFNFTDNLNTSNSSWIRAASFYSCDRQTGFFIIKTDRETYIHRGMTLKIWVEFKNSPSFGSYYIKNIKDRYQL